MRNLFCTAPSLLLQIHAVPSRHSSPHCRQGFTDTPGMKNTMASGKRGGKVSQEFNLCLFSCTSKAFLVLLFKASRHSCNPSYCWGSAHGDPVGWAFQPFNQRLAQIQSKNPTLWGAYSSCPLQEVAVVSCRGAARSQLPSHTHHLWDRSSKLCHRREAEKSHSTQAVPREPHSHLAGCRQPGTLRGAEKEMTYYCLLFHSANREAFIADGTQSNVAQNGEKENAAGKITSIRRGVKRQSAPASQKTCS